jgi:type IV pilus assembly protein PilQ
MTRVNNRMVYNTGVLLTTLLLALGVALSGCGPKQSMPVMTEAQPTAVEVQASTAPLPGSASEPRSTPVTLYTEDDKTWIELGIAEWVDVNPEFRDKSLKLSFSPAAPGFSAGAVSPAGVVRDVEVVSGQIAGTVQALVFTLNEESQFLISRPQPELVKVLLASKGSQQPPAAAAPAAPSTLPGQHMLSGIDFSRDKEGMFYIRINADGGLDYFPRNGREGQMRLVFPDLKVPPTYAKLYRLHKFNLGVRSALLQNTYEGAELVLAMDSRKPMTVERSDRQMLLKFQGSPGSVPLEENPKPTVVALNSPVQAAFTPDQQLEEFNTLFPGMKTHYTGAPCSINLQNAEVEHVLRLICEVSGHNLILDDEVTGKISLKLDSVPWDQALDLVLLQRDLGVVVRGNIMRVSTKTKLQREQADIQKARRAALEAQEAMKTLAPLQTEFIQINYTTAGELMPKVQDFLTERGRATYDQRTNMLIVNATAAQIESIRSVIEKLDRPERQVLIEARVVYATDQFQRAIGIKWGGGIADRSSDRYIYDGYGAGSRGLNNLEPSPGEFPSEYAVNLPAALVNTGLGFTWGKIAGSTQFVLDAQLQLAEEKNLSRVISSPRILTLNNQQAEIRQGTMLAMTAESESGGTTVEYKEAVLKLVVRPQITPDNKLILDMDVSDDAPEGRDISTRSAKTKLIVNDGETIVIGGVLRTTETNNEARTPGLHKLPLFGNMFKARFNQDNKEELLIFIRPKVL